ncbi:MAG TPA: FIST N-terminal domain-containing protein, partial [Clostridia bacterium]|nr:FIST N-terminal domain-containing protein [Clostridia bacterium]
MKVGVGYCDNPDSTLAGRLAAEEALAAAHQPGICDLVLLFCTARHDQKALRREVAKTTGNYSSIYGGGAAGIITNDNFGYAGDQVGVACIWLNESQCNIVCQGGLAAGGEFGSGVELAKKLVHTGASEDSPIMLFYDAVNGAADSNTRLLMGTWLLEGIEKQLGPMLTVLGGGLIGDHILTPTKQFVGDRMDKHQTIALTFSKDIQINCVSLNPCYPASPYYTVTKADGPMILEINNKPAITFMDQILGSSIKPEEYPFLLSLGINYGNSGENYNENNYVCRSCQGIDTERDGIIMFEPDMTAGTKFQVMSRSFGLDYIYPKVENLLDALGDNQPVFAFYIDCAGRCAGFGGTDNEDARVIQDIVGNRFPLFGVYTGGEIAPVGGRSRSLDWTGVFCVFTQGEGSSNKIETTLGRVGSQDKADLSKQHKGFSYNQTEELCMQNLSKVLTLGNQNIALRNELEQKRRGLSLLAEQSVSLKGLADPENIFYSMTQRINAALNMQKT